MVGPDLERVARAIGDGSELDAEGEPMEIVLFKDRRASNYMNPLVARALKIDRPALEPNEVSTASKGAKVIPTDTGKMKIEFSSVPA